MKFDIFVISLDKTPERRKYSLDHLKEIGITPKIFSGVDGSILSEQDLSLVSQEYKIITKLSLGKSFTIDHILSSGEIGCALSHLRLYQKIIDDNYDYAFILEDDAVLNNCIYELFDFIEKWKQKWDVIQLSPDSGVRTPWYAKKYYVGENCYLQQEGFFNKYLDSMFNRRRFCLMTSSYFITKEGCKKLLSVGYPVRMPADVLLGHVASNHIRMYRTHPNKYVKSVSEIGSIIAQRANELKIY